MPKSLAVKLRDAVRQSGLSLTAIAKKTGVAVTTLYEFMDGKDMRLSNADKIAKFLKLELTERKKH